MNIKYLVILFSALFFIFFAQCRKDLDLLEGYVDIVFEGELDTSNNTEEPPVDTTETPPVDTVIPMLVMAFVDDMVSLDGGTFVMGCKLEQGDDCFENEYPAHNVTLSDYKISKYQVTQAQWKAVMGANPSHFNNCDSCPVDNVSWNQVKLFISTLNNLSIKKFRLPTEAEWEYATKGGSRASPTRYAGSDNVNEVAWYGDNSDNKTHPVGQLNSNELGLYDMNGNVWEWCEDRMGNYTSSDKTNPTGSQTGTFRIVRGGSFMNSAVNCRVTNRRFIPPGNSLSSLGFRLVLE